jgi:hypothetical protein
LTSFLSEVCRQNFWYSSRISLTEFTEIHAFSTVGHRCAIIPFAQRDYSFV